MTLTGEKGLGFKRHALSICAAYASAITLSSLFFFIFLFTYNSFFIPIVYGIQTWWLFLVFLLIGFFAGRKIEQYHIVAAIVLILIAIISLAVINTVVFRVWDLDRYMIRYITFSCLFVGAYISLISTSMKYPQASFGMALKILLGGYEGIARKIRKTSLAVLALGTLIFFHYNTPVFQQIFAYHFYRPIQTTQVKPKEYRFGCMTVNISRTDSILEQNKYILRGGTVSSSDYAYEINGKYYESRNRSYTGRGFGCGEQVVEAYYFPLVPEWSVADNSFPEKKYWDNFLISCLILGGIITFYFLFAYIVSSRLKGSKRRFYRS